MKKFSLIRQLKSFSYAFNGIKILIIEEHNARIHLFIALCTIIAGLLLNISNTEWMMVIFAIGLVITLEIINAAIENLADFISPQHNIHIKKIKDLAAGGVLVAAITALSIGLIVFLPKVLA